MRISMKIRELISEIVDTRVKQRKMTVPFDLQNLRRKSNKYTPDSPMGAYVRGKIDPRDPGVFHTISHFPMHLKNDAKLNYILAIRKLIDDNPYFPRTYLVNLRRDSTGLVKPEYKQEKLVSPNKIIELAAKEGESEKTLVSAEAIMDMGERLFPELEEPYRRLRDFIEGTREKGDYYDSLDATSRAWNVLTDKILDLLRGGVDSTDPRLNEVREVVMRLKLKNTNFDVDMHDDNIMLRMTNKGPQLVITDPLYDKDFRSQILMRQSAISPNLS